MKILIDVEPSDFGFMLSEAWLDCYSGKEPKNFDPFNDYDELINLFNSHQKSLKSLVDWVMDPADELFVEKCLIKIVDD